MEGEQVSRAEAAGRVLAVVAAGRGAASTLHERELLRPFAGVPLIVHTVRQARAAGTVDLSIVLSHDGELSRVARELGAIPIEPGEAGQDADPTTGLLRRVRTEVEGNIEELVLLSPWMPIRPQGAIDRAVEGRRRLDVPVGVSVVPIDGAVWSQGGVSSKDPGAESGAREVSVGDDRNLFRETPSIRVLHPPSLETGEPRPEEGIAVEMPSWSSLSLLPDQSPWSSYEEVYQRLSEDFPPASQSLRGMQLIVSDFDGVWTNNEVIVLEDGREAVFCHRGDGFGLERIRDAGFDIVVISREQNPVVNARCRKLGVECHHGVLEKDQLLREILREKDVAAQHAVFIGNDLSDLSCMKIVGCSVAPADAVPAVRNAADLILSRKGGKGALREFCEMLLTHNPPAESSS